MRLLLLLIWIFIRNCQILGLLSCGLLQLTDTLLIRFRVCHLRGGLIFEIISLAVCLRLKLLGVCSSTIVDHFLRICTALRAMIVVETWSLCAAIIPLRRRRLNHGYHGDRGIFIAYPTCFDLRELNPFQLLEPTQIRCRYWVWLWIFFAQDHCIGRLIRIMSIHHHRSRRVMHLS
jgi:hypothetical protein